MYNPPSQALSCTKRTRQSAPKSAYAPKGVTAVIATPSGTSRPTADTTAVPDILLAVYSLAARELTLHRSQHGVCAHCGLRWPCDVAVLAEHNLAL